jgi:uncharacterized membrane protein YphA (DoxX/SURF4 family)
MLFTEGAVQSKSETVQSIAVVAVALLGRILLGQIFFLAGINKLIDPAKTIKLIASHGIPFATFCCFAAAALEIVGSVAFVVGLKIRWSALVLAITAVQIKPKADTLLLKTKV